MRSYRLAAITVETRRALAAWIVALSAALPCGGCILSMPVAGIGRDTDVTGSLAPKPVSPLSPDLGLEDWRRAKGALAIALDPTGSGTSVNWDNPESGFKGSFVPAGSAFVKSDEICRSFVTTLGAKDETKSLHGTACRLSGAEWTITDLKPGKKPTA